MFLKSWHFNNKSHGSMIKYISQFSSSFSTDHNFIYKKAFYNDQ